MSNRSVSRLHWGISYSALLWALAVAAPQPAAAAPQETVLYSFTGGPDGASPLSELLLTKRGALIGTASEGGDLAGCGGKGCGVVFELTPPASAGGQWKEKVLYRFAGGSDGAAPSAGVLMDKTGALYGMTSAGGGAPCNNYKEYLHSALPSSSFYWKKAGQVGCGTIFKLTPPTIGRSVWREEVLFAFSGKDGRSPAGVPLLDKTGVLYGVTGQGGEGPCGYMLVSNTGTSINGYHMQFPTGCGTAFRLTPPAAGQNAWTLTTLHRFKSKPDGAFPGGGVISAPGGRLQGTTHGAYFVLDHATTYASLGYDNKNSYHYGNGTVFQLTPPAAGRTVWNQAILHAVAGSEDGKPVGGLYRDRTGALFGATAVAGIGGAAFRLSPPAAGSEGWIETTLFNFSYSVYPSAGLIADAATAGFYGVTDAVNGSRSRCPSDGCGTVFSLVPPNAGNSKWTKAVLHRFGTSLNDGQHPQARLTTDKAGNLYGTTEAGGAHLYGTVFKISP